jgi:BASS family bile acid:Na+ symporter
VTLETLIRLALLLSIWLIVLSLGARASAQGAIFLLRRPIKLARALAAMFIVVPAFAVLLAATTFVPPAIKFAIVAMSVGPAPPVLPYKQMKAGDEGDYALGLLVAASVASIVLTPLLVAVAASVLGHQAAVDPVTVARTVLLTIGLPLAAGMVLHALSSGGARVIAGIAQRAGFLLLLVVFAVMVIAAWRDMPGLFGNGGALAIAATVGVGLLAGHVLGGEHHRAGLALAAATRHPGVALAIAQMNFPDQQKPITAAILAYLLITALVTAPYVRWARGRGAAPDAWPANRA